MRQKRNDYIFDTRSQRACLSCSGRATFIAVSAEQRIKIRIGSAYRHTLDPLGEGNPVNHFTENDATAKELLHLVGKISPKMCESHTLRPQLPTSQLPAQTDAYCRKKFNLMSIRVTLNACIGEIYHDVFASPI